MIAMPDPDSAPSVADWVELAVAVSEQVLSRTRISRFIEQQTSSEPDDAFLADVWRELSAREKLYAGRPFTVDSVSVETCAGFAAKIPYMACLLMSLLGAGRRAGKSPKLFERLSAVAVKRYLSGDAVVFGWPVQVGRHSSIKDRVRELAERLNERFAEAPRAEYKDRGVDVVGWKPFEEKRSNQIIILLQCAAGQDWRTKTTELPIGSWEQYMHWARNPIPAFAVPSIISDAQWHDISREAGILFDRVRIINLLSYEALDKSLEKELARWVRAQLDSAG
jgi:hypothetical protein